MENWKKVKGSDGVYSVSDKGQVRNNLTGKILKPSPYENGYLATQIFIDGKQKRIRIHRLVAEHFIPNVNNFPYINHKDENRENNNADNLEWCTSKYNNNYGGRNKKIAKTLGHKVYKCDLTGKIIDVYPSIIEAARQNGLCESSIRRACKKSCNISKGYRWRLAVE